MQKIGETSTSEPIKFTTNISTNKLNLLYLTIREICPKMCTPIFINKVKMLKLKLYSISS